MVKNPEVLQERIQLESTHLNRTVPIDLYLGPQPQSYSMAELSLLLINDGQELENMGFAGILEDLYAGDRLSPLLCVGIHAGPERIMEYGTAGTADYLGRGSRAGDYARFVFDELIPAIRFKYHAPDFKEKAFAGFSLGALSAMDIVWRHPEEFSKAGLFSGSFWWRTKDKTDPGYNDNTDRIMQRLIRDGAYYPWLKFFFECGTEDELEDRNHNGIIDSIDDTADLIRELVIKGYTWEALNRSGIQSAVGPDESPNAAIRYLEIEGGRHEMGTWARVMPEFMLWGWGK